MQGAEIAARQRRSENQVDAAGQPLQHGLGTGVGLLPVDAPVPQFVQR